MAASKALERGLNSKFSPSLLDLPQSILLHIAHLLPCKDLPSLICSCRELAAMASAFYRELRVLDMRCFKSLTPMLCWQLVQRFSGARLEKCFFRCDVVYGSSGTYDEAMLRAITERFLDNYRCDDELLSDLHAYTALDLQGWFSDELSPRPVDVLAHCYLLETLLSSQGGLRELYLDIEFGIFRVPKSRGYRQHWHLMPPFLALQVIQKNCPELEKYMASRIHYQSSMVDQRHLQVRFLQNSPRLKFIGITFGLDKAALEGYEQIRRPLTLERAFFLLGKWQSLPEECLLNYQRMRSLAAKMLKLNSVAVMFTARGCLRHCAEFLRHLPSVRSLCLKCKFNAGYPSFDIDEGLESGRFFEGVGSLTPSTVRKLSLLDVPEEEFELLFGENGLKLAPGVEELRVRFVWGSDKLEKPREEIVRGFMRGSRHLRAFGLEAFRSNSLLFEKRFTPMSY